MSPSVGVNAMAKRTSKKSAKAAKPALLAGGNPQIAKADGDAPVQAYIAAMPGWKRDVGRRLDAAVVGRGLVARGPGVMSGGLRQHDHVGQRQRGAGDELLQRELQLSSPEPLVREDCGDSGAKTHTLGASRVRGHERAGAREF